MKNSVAKTRPARQHWLDNPQHVRRLWRGFIVVLALTVVAEFLVTLHPAFAIEGWFGFHAAFGFAACALMIFAAKILGLAIKRQDSYYAGDDVND